MTKQESLQNQKKINPASGKRPAHWLRALDRPDAKTIPIVAMTADAYDEDVRHAREVGMNGHPAKPIDTALLYRTLSELYHSPQQSGHSEEQRTLA